MKITDLEMEEMVLAAACNHQDDLAYLIENGYPALFTTPKNMQFFLLLKDIYNNNLAIDPALLFKMSKEKDYSIDFNYILLMMNSVSSAQIKWYLPELKKIEKNRNVHNLIQAVGTKLEKTEESQDLIDYIQESLDQINGISNKTETTLEEVLNLFDQEKSLSFSQMLEQKRMEVQKGINNLSGLSTGYPLLDYFTDGFQKKWLYVFGARPSEGKTQFLLNLIYNLISKNIPTLMFSLEIPDKDVVTNLATIHSRCDRKRILDGTSSNEEFMRMLKMSEKLNEMPLIIEDQASLTTEQLRLRIKKHVRFHGIRAVFIDYLQELRSPHKHSTQQEAMQYVSRSIREMAKEMNVPIICAAQVNRESEQLESSRPPQSHHLRESGQIEQCAWFIGCLHRPDKTNPDNDIGLLHLYIRKNRMGERGKITFNYQPDAGIDSTYSYRIEQI